MTATLRAIHEHIRRTLQPIAGEPLQLQAECRLLLEELLHMRPEQVLSDPDLPVEERLCRQLNHLLEQRVEKRIPVQYLLNTAWFYGLKFYVNPAVLIPRPETERLVETALSLIRPGQRAVDVGTGSGAIALSLSHHLKDAAEVWAVDISPEALKVARLNQRRLGTTARLMPPGDLLAPVALERFDFILSNPPYVAREEAHTLSPEVHAHEPGLALFSPPGDALHFYRRLAQEGPTVLKPDGMVLVELGAGMASQVSRVFEEVGFSNIGLITDYGGHARVLQAQWTASPSRAG